MKGWFYDSWRHSLAAKGIKSSFYIKAHPLGEGQTRFKIRKGSSKVWSLEPTSVEIDMSWIPKSHKSPITEEEVKEILESGSPEEIAKVREVLIAPRGSMYGGSYAGTYGEAFGGGRIKLYTKPFRSGKFLMSPTPEKVIPESEMQEFYKYEVLPHEIGHVRLGHSDKPSFEEIQGQYERMFGKEEVEEPRPAFRHELQETLAAKFAKDWREKRGIEFPWRKFATEGSELLKERELGKLQDYLSGAGQVSLMDWVPKESPTFSSTLSRLPSKTAFFTNEFDAMAEKEVLQEQGHAVLVGHHTDTGIYQVDDYGEKS